MAQTSTPRLPDTPVSPRRDQWSPSRSSGRPTSRASPHLSPQRPSSNRSGKAPVLADQPDIRLQETPASPISISPPRQGIQAPERASIRGFPGMGARRATQEEAERRYATPDSEHMNDSVGSLPIRSLTPSGAVKIVREEQNHSRASSSSGKAPRIEEFGPPLPPEQAGEEEAAGQQSPGLVYSAFDDAPQKKRQQQRSDKHAQNRVSQMTVRSTGSGSSSGAGSSGDPRASQLLAPQPAGTSSRPLSTSTLGEIRGRTLSPLSYNGSDPNSSPRPYARDLSGSSRRSPSTRPLSYIDLLSNVPYSQQVAPGPSSINNAPLQTAVGAGASLLDTKKTLEMYRANVKKTNDASVQYEFAIFMINTAREIIATDPASSGSPSNSSSKTSGGSLNPTELIQEAKHILQRLSDRAYPFAQYYLADGYSSGFFTNSKPDHDKAFPLFVSASKHGHAEAGYRAALSYEFAWGTSKNYAKAVQFLRASASKGHPGAAVRLALACLRGDMGLPKTKDSYREGCRWLRRAAENADFTHSAGPYELALLHLLPKGFGDDIFPDPPYALQLLTQSAELGHPQAAMLMGKIYEEGLYACPRDAALSVHFYTSAATRGQLPEAMMALCAWFLVGADPVLPKDEPEAFAWALAAAETGGSSKAEYAVGYFTEMGIGCRRDPLEANVWYVRAADSGSLQAKQRLEIIRQAAGATGITGGQQGGEGGGKVGDRELGIPMSKGEAKVQELRGKKGKKFGIF
ncbi:hypothetical protein D0862_14591 [Hortaea werneckii]|uniref:Uncharacterized protein n=1 Tax=Hortaea werneckii TaxID=91943 RepID=A0A3M7E5E8_HORWE|nr:hypothetical protein D0862_14591 [Hortaea werneckii]